MSKLVYLLALILLLTFFLSVYFSFSPYSPPSPTIQEEEKNLSEQSFSYKISNYSIEKFETNVSYPLLFQNIRWNHMPLKVFIDEESCKNLTPFYSQNIQDFKEAMKIWEEKTNNLISFTEVLNREEADIIVEWFKSLNESKEGKIVGEGGPTVIDTGLFNLTIRGEVHLVPSSVSCKNVNRALHELGHVLGLAHTNDRNDIMYPYESCITKISEKAIEALKELYKLKPKPDLYFVNASASRFGKNLRVEFMVKNRGLLTSSYTSVLLSIDSEKIKHFSITDLKPGDAYYLQVSVKIYKNFDKVKLIIDSENLIDELNEENNLAILE